MSHTHFQAQEQVNGGEPGNIREISSWAEQNTGTQEFPSPSFPTSLQAPAGHQTSAMGEDLCKLTRAQLESILGFTANQMTPLDPATERFYYDFKPVPHDPSARLGREWRELERAKKPHHRKPKTSLDLPKVGESLVSSRSSRA